MQQPNQANEARVIHPAQYDVFLSHNNEDKKAVRLLARRLREFGVDPWLDEWNLIPGEPWQEEVENTLITSCRTCAIFWGPGGLGPWQSNEMRVAIHRQTMSSDFRVIPVLLPGGSKEPSQFLPPFLQRITWVEITDCNNDHEGFGRLLCGIKGSMPGPVVAQKMAQWRVGLGGSLKEFDKDRQEVLDRLREILLDPHLTIILVEEGSIVLHLKGSRFALERLQTLISLGQLKELAGLEILHVLEEPSQQQGGAVAPHWLGKKMIRRILFVDDDQNLAQTVCQILQSHGYVAKSAHSGNAAMEMFKQELFDLAIVDFRLEDMDGISLASEIHKMAPAVPIIIVTGYERIEPTAEIVTCIHKENLFPALSDVIKQLSKAA